MYDELPRALKKIGLPPGSLVYTGEGEVDVATIDLIEYDDSNCFIRKLESIEDYQRVKETKTRKWINIKGVHNLDMLTSVGQTFNISPLTLEDIMNMNTYSKAEMFNNYLFIVLKIISYNKTKDDLEVDQLSIILTDNAVVTFQDTVDDLLFTLKERLVTNDIFKKHGPDYLTYTIIDLIVDRLFDTINTFSEKVDQLEDKVVIRPDSAVLTEIIDLKKDVMLLRSCFRSLRNLVSVLSRPETPFVNDYLNQYLRDVNDHIMQLIEVVEIHRETIIHMIDIYLSSANNKMAEVMKVLTIIATIFIPLTFVAGVYGMNFKNMPELDWQYGYYYVLFIMFLIFLSMIVYFKQKKWL